MPREPPATIVRATLFVPGPDALAEAGKKLDGTISVEWVENDGSFGKAFSFGTVPAAVLPALESAPGALVVHFPVDLRQGRKPIVAAVTRLRDAGALAVRLEQSKVGWEISRWLELFSSDAPSSWHRGAVAYLSEDQTLQSCGMHAFSLPDVHMTLDGAPDALRRLAALLCVYQIAEDPLLVSGHTFAPDRDTPRRLLERWPDTGYPSSHPCHNPYGVWRVGPPGGSARPTGELTPVFIPSLRVLLTALEGKVGRPLTRAEVEATRDRGQCMMMKQRDAQSQERARGFADLDPELAWEQWQLVRGDEASARS